MKYRIEVSEVQEKSKECTHYSDECKRRVYSQELDDLDVAKLAVFLNEKA